MVNKKQAISVHAPKARKPQGPQFGFFLAGLIDARGRIAGSDVSLCFNKKDASSAYFIKKMIGYGKIHSIKDENYPGETARLEQPALRYQCTKFEGCLVIADLIRDKLKSPAKIELFNHMCSTLEIEGCDLYQGLDTTISLNNHWLAGFIQGSGYFQIEIISKDRLIRNKFGDTFLSVAQKATTFQTNNLIKTSNCLSSWEPAPTTDVKQLLVLGQPVDLVPKVDVKIVIQMEQVDSYLLKQIQINFGGRLGFRESDNTYYYNTVSSKLAPKFIKYLDSYQLLATNLTPYWLWRKAYLRVQSKAYLTEKGFGEISRWKNTITKFWK